jgi:hypothetical protein
MPNPADYPDEDSYRSAVQEQTHPLTTDRLLQVALDIETNAEKYAIDGRPETLASFQDLSRGRGLKIRARSTATLSRGLSSSGTSSRKTPGLRWRAQ